MTDDELTGKITDTAQSVFKQTSLAYQPGLVFREIPGFDSVRAVQFILAIEQALDVMLTEEEVDGLHTMGDLFGTLRRKPALSASV